MNPLILSRVLGQTRSISIALSVYLRSVATFVARSLLSHSSEGDHNGARSGIKEGGDIEMSSVCKKDEMQSAFVSANVVRTPSAMLVTPQECTKEIHRQRCRKCIVVMRSFVLVCNVVSNC
jgi:hypothetical protein